MYKMMVMKVWRGYVKVMKMYFIMVLDIKNNFGFRLFVEYLSYINMRICLYFDYVNN